jgi:hypothetical protein
MTEQEWQSLRNLGNEAEAAADEIERLRKLAADRLEQMQADRKEALAWRKDAERFRWLAGQHWVEPEAVFRLNLDDTDDSESYFRQLVDAIDSAMGKA